MTIPQAPSPQKSARNEALRSVKSRAATMRAMVLSHIRDRAKIGSTCDEAEMVLDMSHQTCSARIHELAREGAIVPSGFRETRTGRKAVVYISA